MAELEEASAASSSGAATCPAGAGAGTGAAEVEVDAEVQAQAKAAGVESNSSQARPIAACVSTVKKSSLGSVVLYVPLPIQKVWDIVSDLFGERYGWPKQVSITPLTLNGVSVGARRRVADKADPHQAWVIERLVAVEPQEYWYTYTVDECPEPGIIGSSGLMQLFSEKSLAEGEEEKTRVVWSYALLPQEGEQYVPRTRMDQVRQTLVAYLMGIEDLDHGHLADDSSSDESDSDDDEPPPAHTQALHTQQGLLVDAPTQKQQQQPQPQPQLQLEEGNPPPTQPLQEEAPHPPIQPQQDDTHQPPTQPQEATPAQQKEAAPDSSNEFQIEPANQDAAASQPASRPEDHPPPVQDQYESSDPAEAAEERGNSQGNKQHESRPGPGHAAVEDEGEEGKDDRVQTEDSQ